MSAVASFDGGLAEMGRFLEAVGKALQKQGPTPAIGELISESDYIGDLEFEPLRMRNEKMMLKLSTRGFVNIRGTQIDLGEYGSLRVPHGLITEMNVKMELQPEYDGQNFAWFQHAPKQGAPPKPLPVGGRRIIIQR
jgi:hypothetical protein